MYAIPLLLLFAGDAKPFDVPAKDSHYVLTLFAAKHKATLSVTSEKAGDVDLFVIDAFGKTIAKDTTIGKDCKLEFASKEEQIVLVKVTNLRNRRAVVVRINDRGPIVPGRIIDVSYSAARALKFQGQGTQRVRLDVVPARKPAATMALLREPTLGR